MTASAKASSCTIEGELDGWEVADAFSGEMDPTGSTRLCLTVGEQRLAAVHVALLEQLAEPISVLYRRKIDRLDPKPQGHPGADFVALEQRRDRVIAAVREASLLLHHDARCELWIRGGLKEQVVLDQDGTLYCYPDDPVFRDVAEAQGLTEAETMVTLEGRDYVRHWFRAEADALEQGFIAALQLTEVPVQKG